MPRDTTEPSISCVIPAFNAEAFLGEAIESVLGQSRPTLEVVVVDDGSTDRTAHVVRSFGQRLVYLLRPHAGVGAAMNAGVRAARGTHIAFLDADDLWHPDKLARQVDRLARRRDIDLCFTQYQNFWVPELEAEEGRYRGTSLARPISGWSVSTLLAARQSFERFGLFGEDPKLKHAALVWALQAARQGAVVEVLPEVLLRRRLHPGNLSRTWTVDEGFFSLLRSWRDFKRTEAGAANEE